MQAVILAGGLGHRLRPFTDVLPKPLLPLGEKSILEVQICRLRECGVREVFVAVNYLSDLVAAFLGDGSRFGVQVHISKECQPLGTCGPLSLLRDRLAGPFLVMNGDILTKLDFRDFLTATAVDAADLTVATKLITTPFRFGNVSVGPDNAIVDVDEKPELVLEVVAGIYGMKPPILAQIPDNEYFGMDALIKQMIGRGDRVARYLIRDYWIDIGQVDDYSTACDVYREHFMGHVGAP